jgi:phosphomannomutase
MSIFKAGEKVRVIESEKSSDKVYTIKKIIKREDGTPVYLLKSEDEDILRLYYESETSGLERLVIPNTSQFL